MRIRHLPRIGVKSNMGHNETGAIVFKGRGNEGASYFDLGSQFVFSRPDSP